MGKKLRKFLKKKIKNQGQKKRKLTTGQIEVLFETGTGGVADPTISEHADPQTTPNPLDSQPGPSGQNGVCRRKLPEIPKNKPCPLETVFLAVQERAPVSTTDHKPAINRALKPYSNSATNPTPSAWAFDSRLSGNIAQVQSTPTFKHNFPDFVKIENNKAARMPARDRFDTYKMDDGGPWKQSNRDTEGIGLGMGDNYRDSPNLQQGNSQLRNVLSRCLTFFEKNSILTQGPEESELVQEIREVLAINSTNPFVPKRLQEAQTGCFSEPLPSQGPIPDDMMSFSDSDNESFVSAASSFTSLEGAHLTCPNPFNKPQMEPSTYSRDSNRGQQTPPKSGMMDICSKLHTAVNQLNNLVSSLFVPNISIPNSPDALPLRGNNPFTSELNNKLPSNQKLSPFNPFCAIDTSDMQTAPSSLPAIPGHSNKSVPSKAAFDEFLTKHCGQLSGTALSSSTNSSLAPSHNNVFEQLVPNVAVHNFCRL